MSDAIAFILGLGGLFVVICVGAMMVDGWRMRAGLLLLLVVVGFVAWILDKEN